MDAKRMIQLLRSNETSLTRRLSALEELFDLGTPEALLAVTHAAYSQSPELADRARSLIRTMGYTQCENLLSLLLEDTLNAYTRKRAFDLLREEKPREILKYVLQHADELQSDPPKAKLLANWLRQTKLTQEWIRDMMVMPLQAAIQLAMTLKKVDATLPLAIARIVKNGGPKARLRAMDILGKIADNRDIVPFVIGATASNDAELRSKAILVLGRTSEKLSLIENALSDEDPRVRANAVESLWGIDSDDAQMLLRQAVRDPNNRVRANAAKGLYELGHPLGYQTLAEMLESDDPKMRISAAWALGEVNALESIPKLRQLLHDPDEAVRRNAALALDKMGVRLLSMRRYFRLFKEEVGYFPDTDISSVARFITAARTLVKFSPKRLLPLLEEVAAISPAFSQRALERLRQRCEADERVDVIYMMVALFAKEDPLRAKATEVVARFCQEKAFFDTSLEDESAEVRLAVVASLCQNLIPEAQEILSTCLADPDPYVVVYAAQGLYELKDPRGVETLTQKLQDPDPNIRIAATEAIARGIVHPLMKQVERLAAEDPERRVRSAAARALEHLQRAEEEAVLRSIRVHIEHISMAEFPLIQCYVSVLGESGQVVRDLRREHFTLEETGIEQRAYQLEVAPSSVPMHVVFALDTSDEMDPSTLESIQQGVARIIDALPEGAKVSIIKYASEVQIIQEPTVERDLLQRALETPYDGDTEEIALYDALFAGIEPIAYEDSIRVVVAFVSGDDTCSDQSSMKLIRYAANHHICIHVIQCGEVSDRDKLQSLARSTHGEYWVLSPSLSMSAACRRMADILSYHYLLSYPTAPRGPMRGIATLSVAVNCRHFSSRMTVPLPRRSVTRGG